MGFEVLATAAPSPTRRDREAVSPAPARAPARPPVQLNRPRAQEPVAAETSEPDSTAPAPTPSAPVGVGRVGVRDLSPLAAARTFASEQPSGWSVTPARADTDQRAAVDRATEDRLALAVPELSRNGENRVDHVAEEVTSLIAKPWEFIRRPMRGARYHFRGVGFDALIRADGSVQYRDKSGFQSMTGSTAAIGRVGRDTLVRSEGGEEYRDKSGLESSLKPGKDAKPVPTFGIGFRDSPVANLLGGAAHASERRSFLERTRALRELLYERAVRVALERASEHLKMQLRPIASELDGGDPKVAHTRLFALWDECSEDEVGMQARRRIAAFIRESCPEGSAQAFTPDELSTLNQRRASRQPFAPYAQSSDAGEPSGDL